MGFMMGGITGGCLGFLVGGMTVLRYGPGDKGYLATVGNQMLQTGGFLGFIMSIGMVVRAESVDSLPPSSLFRQQQQKRPMGAFWSNGRRLPIVIEKMN
ncbi:hypothetical protein CcCBS67573_g05310 [Chytriomyces confervae]|uniref:Reactive oxygen species modulator 1 n=1 Tax=Chytriomyces confervae TaxID=246404 RepID=A0A507FB56_9FUNG|nr:hypothetical protein CcCBS67573_g05310 [Chytriomyces confervae]